MCNTIINKHLENLFNIDISNLICLYNGNKKFDSCKYNCWQFFDIENNFIDYNILYNYCSKDYPGLKYIIKIMVYIEYYENEKNISYRMTLLNGLDNLYIYTDEEEIIDYGEVYITKHHISNYLFSNISYINNNEINKLVYTLKNRINDYILNNN
jgi:hypothetical protein